MKLIDILVRELPKRGGWPLPYVDTVAVQDSDYEIKFCLADCELKFERNNPGLWGSNSQSSWLDPCQSLTPESISHDYESSKVTREQYESALAASKPEWDGEGLPPVGTICEGYFPRHRGIKFEWQECLVLYVFERECAVKAQGTSTLHYCDEFRPIRSEADKKRDDISSAIFDVISESLTYGSCSTSLALYDAIAAGKVPGVKLEG